jgi:3-hydroxyacyl-[acyl-carrier-protein] dehydratase
MTEWTTRGMLVPETHATAAGHFPGRPVVPGALLLDEVARALAGSGALNFRSVKFLAPVRHGEPIELRWQSEDGGLYRFEIRRTGEPSPVVAGTLEVAA